MRIDSSLTKTVDISRFTGQVYYKDWVKVRDTAGIEAAIVGSWHGTKANKACEDTLGDAHAADLILGTYIVLNHRDGKETVEKGIDICGAQWKNLDVVALDIELNGVTENIIGDALTAIFEAEKQTPIIYTGGWFWRGHLGNPDWFSHIPLWDSYYNGVPKLELVRPYGGWTDVIGKQYYGTKHHENLGFQCDLSVFDFNKLKAPKG